MNLKLSTQVMISLKMLFNHLALKQTNILMSYGLNNTIEIAIKKIEQHLTTNLINENVTNGTTEHGNILLISRTKNGTFITNPPPCLCTLFN